MPKLYLIAVIDDNILYYLAKDRTLFEFSSVYDAIKFDSLEDVLMYASTSTAKQFLESGFCIVTAFESAIENAKNDRDMFKKLHDPNYMLWGIVYV